MPSIDALLLARIQFGFTISFHIIFPALTIGLASYLAVLEGSWLYTRNEVYRDVELLGLPRQSPSRPGLSLMVSADAKMAVLARPENVFRI